MSGRRGLEATEDQAKQRKQARVDAVEELRAFVDSDDSTVESTERRLWSILSHAMNLRVRWGAGGGFADVTEPYSESVNNE